MADADITLSVERILVHNILSKAIQQIYDDLAIRVDSVDLTWKDMTNLNDQQRNLKIDSITIRTTTLE